MSIIRSAFTVGFFTFVSRIIGFLRECVMVFFLGAGMYTDALLVALRLANTFRRIFAEGAFNSSFLPRFSKVLHNEGKNEANVILSDVFSALSIILTIFCAIILLFFPSVLRILVSGFDILSEKFGLTVILGRICFPYLIFISITSLFAGVLNTINKFALPAAMHSILSVFTITALLLSHFFDLSSFLTVHIISVFVLLSGIAQSYILFFSIKQNGFFISTRWKCWTNRVSDIMKHMIPGIIGAGVWQINILVDTTISSYLPTGTITCINLADRLNQFPLGTLGIALSTALLPSLSKHISMKKYEEAGKDLERGLVFACFLTFFATTVMIALDIPTVSVAFQRGLFEEDQVIITASALVGLTIGLPAYILTKVFSAVYFASGDTKSPVIFGTLSVILNAIFLITLVPFLKYLGLGLCTSLSAISNSFMLIYFLNKKIRIKFSKNFTCNIFAQICASVFTYCSLTKLSDMFWIPEFGSQIIKWPIYIFFIIISICCFFFTTALILKLFQQDNWKLWKKESW